MPGLVSVKSPPDSAPLQVSVPDAQRSEPVNSKPPSPLPKKLPSPSSSRSKFSPRKPPPETPTLDLNPNSDSALENPDLGPFLLKLARDAIASGEGPTRALDYALRASQSFERCAPADGEPSLDLAMSLHVLAAIYCSLGRFEEAVPSWRGRFGFPTLREVRITRSPRSRVSCSSGTRTRCSDRSINPLSPTKKGLRSRSRPWGSRIRESERLAEAHVQAMEFDRAEELCKKTLEIHHVHSEPASLAEAADRRLMALICEAKGDYETALEHLVLASMAMIANGQDTEVAAIDVSIGSIYMSLCRYDEALFSYQKALTVFKSSKGENHPSVASVFAHLADLYHRTGKLRDSKSYCENALKIYAKPVPGATAEDIAGGLTEISAIYESVDEPEEALKLLQKAMKMLEDKPGQQSTIAGIEARMGVMFYMVGSYEEARNSFESAIAKLRACGERKSAFFGVVLNQMGLASVQLFKIDEAAELFEEARGILEQECGPFHQDTIGVYGNLAATYDAMGRVNDAIEILEYVLKLREEKLGIANPDFEEEKKRLAELLKEAGRTRDRKAKSLENLIDPNSKKTKKEVMKKWPSLGFRI
ncbi:hypothetical protein I3842_12G078700 [Carya illinoinensis]|uniref:Uncharacterized protein n=1 Tax=Carya illinoinensis TaxID=32201 RepID=A0A922DI13_CARIL|nr:hypothetical protein I3842_12G078700 [Carya illinoinensis]